MVSNENPGRKGAGKPEPYKLRYRKSKRTPPRRKFVLLSLLGAALGAAVLFICIWHPFAPRETPTGAAALAVDDGLSASIQRYLDEGNFGAAAGLLYQAIERAPGEEGNYLLLSSIYERNRDYDAAIDILERFSQVGASETVTAKLESLRKDRERWAGWNEKAQAISAAIDAIGEVTLEKQELILEARSQYDSATDPVKALVGNYTALAAAEQTLKELLEAQEAEKNAPIQELIDAINGIGGVSIGKEKAIRQIRAQYDAASDEVKAGVTNLDVLEKAEQDLQKLKELEAQREAQDRADREAAQKAAEEAKKAAEQQNKNEVFKLDVPYMSQEGVLPTGCELISSIMVLRHYGYFITPANFIDNYLPRGELVMGSDGNLHGPHPNEAFIGDPYSIHGYGTYAPVIVNSLKKITGGGMDVKSVGGPSLAQLTETYVKNGTPVLVWATIGMRASTPGTQWILDDGSAFTWKRSEHCLVLVGYDSKYYYFNDPYNSNGVVAYEKGLAEQRYRDMGSQAVVMQKWPEGSGGGSSDAEEPSAPSPVDSALPPEGEE